MSLKLPSIDEVTTINRDGSHYFLHPADVSGRFTVARRVFALLLIGLYVALPWVTVNGFPAVFLDVRQRSFHLFGFTFAPQDLWLGFLRLLGLGFRFFTPRLYWDVCGVAGPVRTRFFWSMCIAGWSGGLMATRPNEGGWRPPRGHRKKHCAGRPTMGSMGPSHWLSRMFSCRISSRCRSCGP